MRRRVVVTGMGLTSPIGNTPDEVVQNLEELRGGVSVIEEWARYKGMLTRLHAPVTDLALKYPRKQVRTMGRVSLLALYATEQALADAGLARDELGAGNVGISYGSTHGSSSAMENTLTPLFSETPTLEYLASSSYVKFMSHTCAANLAIYFGVKGRIHTTCSACTSGSQGVGYGYEAVRDGFHDVMICGGAEEMHPIHAGVFDVMFATSTNFNDRPELSPRPYDKDRDGLVVGEGAGTLILESLEHAQARGAKIHAEIVGYGTNCDGMHATSPSRDGMAGAMRLALQSASLEPDAIQYVNGHGTATELGDIAESHATNAVFGERVPISSTKSYTGHTLGACGAVESVFCIEALKQGFMPPTRNLETPDDRCAPLDYVREVRREDLDVIMNNNFAFGGINTSLIFRKV